ncbi:hypothetical protein [Bradyrhizobium archetypum]|uniref:hypothetical protein n=1 Tax=Bradyrhizobium archetypum TaxID=2721160 RepID=UPI001F464984|nr:hypothetical protein [Bradyrhizobium archetypum]
MNAPFNTAQNLTKSDLPAEFESLSPPPLLLHSLEKYNLMRQAIFADLAPSSVIEWLLAIDVVELSWEIQRYRVLRHKLLDHYREKAIEQTLRRIDLAELPPEMEDAAHDYIRRNARIWRVDPTAAREMDGHLATYRYDSNAINTQVYLQARDVFLAFEDPAK